MAEQELKPCECGETPTDDEIAAMEELDDWLDDDYCCYECQGYGDDYYMDEHGELVSACDDCPHNKTWRDDND